MSKGEFGTAAVKKTQVYEWHKRYRDGRVSANDDPRCGQQKESRA
jgi:hypothetical protein